MTEEPPTVQEVIRLVMEEIGPIAKDQVVNMGQGKPSFSYRGVDSILNAAHPAFVKHRLVVTPHSTEVAFNGNLVYVTVTYHLTGPDGDWMPAVGVGSGSANQAQGASVAQSNAFKSAMFQAFSVPVADVSVDGEQVSPGDAAPLAWPADRARTVMQTLDLFDDDLVARFWERLTKEYGSPVGSLDDVAYSERWDDQVGKLLIGAENAQMKRSESADEAPEAPESDPGAGDASEDPDSVRDESGRSEVTVESKLL